MKKGYVLAGCLLAVTLVGCSKAADPADAQIAADTMTRKPGTGAPPGLRHAIAPGGKPAAPAAAKSDQ